ncbi:Ferric enterobactin transport ATP-binding protein FepC [Paenibacillus sp. CECT 9249]|uniref:ABC transporter ATP-binding protein n=1 Tax=Paenibacillus sp. CECT 9249 TaxID=2845385 RepID=UPI001E3F0FB5|nr:ABC transporter ATP-binding protein [Paenibacillus sp. CECT 9249]CAH0121500.1 Ferric enterobactin transport ATP-binding protein FepC [Paenibacillus sp. CECT 9249]
MIRVENVAKRYGETTVLRDICFSAARGEWLGIIGPNGSGKSTLLHLLSGVEAATSGTIEVMGKDVASYSRKELSRILAVLQQDALPPIGYTVREVMEMGRFPFQNWLGQDSRDAEPLLSAITQRLNLDGIVHRTLDELSGGQRQRAALGKVMAQEPEVLLLDEPTTYLDIHYQIQFMDYVRSWQRECGLTVIAVLHDLNLAAQYCDRLLLLHEGKLLADGAPDEIIRKERIRQVFGVDPIVISHPLNRAPQILLQPEDGQQERTFGGGRDDVTSIH